MWALPAPLLPTAMTFSRRWMYSHRASSITSALFTEGMPWEVEGVQAIGGGEAGGAYPLNSLGRYWVEAKATRLPWCTPALAGVEFQ